MNRGLHSSLPQRSGDDSRRLAAFVALGAAQALIYFGLAAWPGTEQRPGSATTLALFAFSLYAAALAVARPLSSRRALIAAVVLGVLFRALLIPEPPSLSDDYYRYLWDGLLQHRGINPYRYAPSDPAVAGLDEALRARVNHPTVPTIYPPLAQFAFFLTRFLPGGWLALKAVWLFLDLGLAALLYRMVPEGRRTQAWTLYWWSPLVVIEVAGNAHLDLLGVLPLVAALWWARRSAIGVGLSLAGAGLVKYFPAVLLPAAIRRTGARSAAAFIVAAIVLYLPYASAGPRLFAGLLSYAQSWRFNDGLFAVLAWGLGSAAAAKALALAVVGTIAIQSVRNDWSLTRAAFWVTGALIILSPTVHPWYLVWMVPLVAIRPNRAWLYLTGSVFLAYYGLATYRAQGFWPEPGWLKLAEYGPFFALLLIDGWRGSWWQAAWEALDLTWGRRRRVASTARPATRRPRR